ncbi:MAG: phosphatase PAP2 family protein [Bacillota bacterium]
MERLDIALFRLINGLAGRWPLLDDAGRLMTWAGYAGAVWLLIALIFLLRRQRRASFSVVLVLAVTGLLDTLIKLAVGRPRPPFTLPDVNLLLPVPDSYSFVSGHGLTSFAAATLIALTWRQRGVAPAVLALAAAIAWSRIHVGHHYPSDVLAGSVLGVLTGYHVWVRLRPAIPTGLSRDA